MVADKEFYYSTYHGKLSEADVEGCLARAEYMLHSLTLDRLQNGAWQQDETLANACAWRTVRWRTPSTPRTRPCWRAAK